MRLAPHNFTYHNPAISKMIFKLISNLPPTLRSLQRRRSLPTPVVKHELNEALPTTTREIELSRHTQPNPSEVLLNHPKLRALIELALRAEFDAWCEWEADLWDATTGAYRPKGFEQTITDGLSYADHSAGPRGTIYHGKIFNILHRKYEQVKLGSSNSGPTMWEGLFGWYGVDDSIIKIHYENVVKESGVDLERRHIFYRRGSETAAEGTGDVPGISTC